MEPEQMLSRVKGEGTQTLRSKMEKRGIPYIAQGATYTVITAKNNHGCLMRFNEYEKDERPRITIEISGLSPKLAAKITSEIRRVLIGKSHKPTVRDAIEILWNIKS